MTDITRTPAEQAEHDRRNAEAVEYYRKEVEKLTGMPYPPRNAVCGCHPIGHPWNDMTQEQRIADVEVNGGRVINGLAVYGPPPRPEPPPSYLVCDNCLKPAGTCWCRSFYLVASVLFVLGLIGNAIAYYICNRPQ